MDIMEDLTVKEFLQNRSLKPNTIINYTEALKKYSTFTGLTPNQLILEAEKQEDEGNPYAIPEYTKIFIKF
jgi:hypothetical protein